MHPLQSCSLIYNDLEPMTEQEKRAAGLPKARMPRAVWPLLSDAGRADTWQAIKETTTHMILAVQRERTERQRREHPEIWT
jgi:hypothetical protein